MAAVEWNAIELPEVGQASKLVKRFHTGKHDFNISVAQFPPIDSGSRLLTRSANEEFQLRRFLDVLLYEAAYWRSYLPLDDPQGYLINRKATAECGRHRAPKRDSLGKNVLPHFLTYSCVFSSNVSWWCQAIQVKIGCYFSSHRWRVKTDSFRVLVNGYVVTD